MSSLTYGDYLKLDQLLALQQPRSAEPEHDELLFIVIHQVYELWFKEILHELDHLQQLLENNQPFRALHTLHRILTIFKTMVAQVDVLETMTPVEFLSFRSYLDAASGFQSYQFRELEFVLGHKRQSVLQHYHENQPVYRRLTARYQQRTLWDAFLAYLAQNGYAVPTEALQRDVTAPLEPSPAVQTLLIDAYRAQGLVAQLCERLTDLDEGVQEWRYRHVKMVERTIGTKTGTGGSTGAAYLSSTLFKPLFPDLWLVRTQL
ncbi:MAG: tryptophan 2,3-dioxygenase family protein [Caldilineaceae bacterium]